MTVCHFQYENQRNFPDLRNTYQMVFVTDNRRRSYVIFFYEQLQWDSCVNYNRVNITEPNGNLNISLYIHMVIISEQSSLLDTEDSHV